ncbi:MAG: hypothetical protein ACK4TA_16365 [Saprospiraceae bacterium]
MKRIIILIMVALLAGSGLYAQRGGRGGGARMTPDERATMAVQRLTATVEMTDAQKTQVTELYKNFFTESQPFRAERNQAKVMELAAARDAKVKTVLNNEEKFKAYMKQVTERQSRALQRNNQPGNRKGNGNCPRKAS